MSYKALCRQTEFVVVRERILVLDKVYHFHLKEISAISETSAILLDLFSDFSVGLILEWSTFLFKCLKQVWFMSVGT